MKKRAIIIVIAVLIIAATEIIAGSVQSHKRRNEAAIANSSMASQNVAELEIITNEQGVTELETIPNEQGITELETIPNEQSGTELETIPNEQEIITTNDPAVIVNTNEADDTRNEADPSVSDENAGLIIEDSEIFELEENEGIEGV